MIHSATLLHDDVIDDGQRRRGAPTINSLCGNESAVLLGDFVLSRVFKMAAGFEPAVATVIAQTAVRVCEGELRQVIQKRNWQLDEAAYIDIITEKSAAFFSGCCRIGAMLAHAPDDAAEALSRYGLYAGIAFQITDDVLDITGDEEQMGKGARNDFETSKLTLAVSPARLPRQPAVCPPTCARPCDASGRGPGGRPAGASQRGFDRDRPLYGGPDDLKSRNVMMLSTTAFARAPGK